MSGAQLKRVREGLGLSRKRFADLLEVDQVTIWRWEKQKKIPRVVELAVDHPGLKRSIYSNGTNKTVKG